MYRNNRKVVKAPKGKVAKIVAGKIVFVDKPVTKKKRYPLSRGLAFSKLRKNRYVRLVFSYQFD